MASDNSIILGIDLGIKRTGLAVSDPLGLTTRALDTLTPKSRAEDIDYLLLLCEKLDVTEVLIGYPISGRDGEESMMARRARGFAEKMNEVIQTRGIELPVHLMDESLTSKEAAKRLAESEIRRSKRKGLLDGEAARVLIEEYLGSQRSVIPDKL